MPAKPVIDILMAVSSVEAARQVTPGPLAALGYAFWSENPKRDRLFFVKGLPPSAPRRTHHLHLCEMGSEMWQRLIFRDVLRDNLVDAQRYAALKQTLAAEHRSDREAYTKAKTTFVAATVAMAASRTQAPAPQPDHKLCQKDRTHPCPPAPTPSPGKASTAPPPMPASQAWKRCSAPSPMACSAAPCSP
jgi:hypothetical protein